MVKKDWYDQSYLSLTFRLQSNSLIVVLPHLFTLNPPRLFSASWLLSLTVTMMYTLAGEITNHHGSLCYYFGSTQTIARFPQRGLNFLSDYIWLIILTTGVPSLSPTFQPWFPRQLTDFHKINSSNLWISKDLYTRDWSDWVTRSI
jgi:hypothetical protein